MLVYPTDVPEVLLIEPEVHEDERGFFLESYREDRYREAGIGATFVQDNHSYSQRGTLRGLHAQHRRPQDKLVRVVEGEVLDVAVDIRLGSPTFGVYTAAILSGDNFRQLFIPGFCAHGFCVLSETVHFEYKCSDVYDPGGELSIAWNDPDIGIRWPIEEPTVSKKDLHAPRLTELPEELLPRYEGSS